MGNKYQFGIFTMALAALVILITSPVAATPSVNFSLNQTTLNTTDASMEFVQVVAGKDKAVLANIFSLGNVDGSSYPFTVGSTGLIDAYQWVVLYSNLDGFEANLNRRPMDSPDGLVLYLTYEASGNSFSWAASASATVAAAYGVSALNLLYADTVSDPDFDYYAFQLDPTDALFTSVADDTVAISSNGFAALMSTSKVTSAPFGWTGFGVGTIDYDGSLSTNNDRIKISLQGMGWVDANGIVASTALGVNEFQYTLDTQGVFGATVTPLSSPSFGLSRVKFTIPYPISPVTNGITPDTTNPLPHVTGQMVWDLRHPTGDVVPSVGDYKVTFTLGMDRAFPMIQNEMTIDQNKLNNQGTLEVVFNLQNVGGEDASNIFLNFPLGPEFNKLMDRPINIYKIKDGLTIDETFGSNYTIDLSVAGFSQVNYEAFELLGWYTNVSTSQPAIWSGLGGDTFTLFSGTMLGQAVTLEIQSTNGFPSTLRDAIQTHIVDNMPTTITSTSQITDVLRDNLGAALKQAFNESLNAVYIKERKFLLNQGDFTLVGPIEVATGPASTRQEYFLQANIASLAAGASTTVSFGIDQVPIKEDKLAFMQFNPSSDPVTGYPKAQLTSELENYNSVLQYAFSLIGYDGRPISFELPDSFNLHVNQAGPGTYGSMGMAFTWENTRGYPFFGLSNGLNLQIADDEATVSATTSLNSQVYAPGDTKTVTVDLRNNGDLPAENVVVHIFHSSLGRDYQLFERVQEIGEVALSTPLAPGATTQVQVSVEANSFLGYSPVFAVVEFDSDVGQSAAVVPDFLDVDDTSSTVLFEPAGETHQFVMSTLSGALLLPDSFVNAPSIPEARVTVERTVSGNSVTYVLTNEGSADTNVTFVQSYDKDIFTVTDSDVTVSPSATVGVFGAAGLVTVDDMQLAVGGSVTITIDFDSTSGGTIPPAVVEFTIDGESSLGDTVNMGGDVAVGGSTPLLGLAAGAAAQQQSQQSATQDSRSSAFSASTSVGADVNTDVQTETTDTAKSILGPSPLETLALFLIPVTLLSFKKKFNK